MKKKLNYMIVKIGLLLFLVFSVKYHCLLEISSISNVLNHLRMILLASIIAENHISSIRACNHFHQMALIKLSIPPPLKKKSAFHLMCKQSKLH